MRANAETLLLHWQYYKRPPHKQIKDDSFYGDAVNKGFVYDISDDQSALYRRTAFQLEKMQAEGTWSPRSQYCFTLTDHKSRS